MNLKGWPLVREYAPLTLATTAALLLSLEYWLQRAGYVGLCPTDGCEVVGTFVKFGETTLIGLGVIFLGSDRAADPGQVDEQALAVGARVRCLDRRPGL